MPTSIEVEEKGTVFEKPFIVETDKSRKERSKLNRDDTFLP
jgi:hypothetical protein